MKKRIDDKVAENFVKGIDALANRQTLFYFLIFCGVVKRDCLAVRYFVLRISFRNIFFG